MIDRILHFARKPFRDQLHAIGSTIRAAVRISQIRARLRLRRIVRGPLAAPDVFKGSSQFYVAYRPDWDVTFHTHPELLQLSEKWVADNLTNNAGDLPRLYSLLLNITRVFEDAVPGDLAELGVYRGNSAAVFAHYARQHGRQLHLFDTFEGFDRRDLTGDDRNTAIEFADTSLEQVQRAVGMASVHWIKGYFPASVPTALTAARFCVVHIDCDLYEPMKAGLEFFFPRLSPGGLLILHDYSNPHWIGARRAIDEFMSGITERLILLPDKSGTAMLRRSLDSPTASAGAHQALVSFS